MVHAKVTSCRPEKLAGVKIAALHILRGCACAKGTFA